MFTNIHKIITNVIFTQWKIIIARNNIERRVISSRAHAAAPRKARVLTRSAVVPVLSIVVGGNTHYLSDLLPIYLQTCFNIALSRKHKCENSVRTFQKFCVNYFIVIENDKKSN